MNTIKTTWISKLVSGTQLDAQAQELEAMTAQLDEQKANMAALQNELSNTKQELQVRTDIMDLTSIVSFADLKGDIVTVNDKFVEVSKYARAELIGQPHNTTRHPDMPKETFKEVWSTIKRGNTFRGLIKNRAKDGTPYYVDAVIAPFIGERGKPTKYLGVRYDITEQEIERQNAKGVLGAIDDSYGYIEFDLSGNILNANKNFLDLMEYQLDEIEGKHHRMFVDPAQSVLPDYAQFWANLNAGKAQNNAFKRITKSGAEVWIQAVYAPVTDEMGRVFKIVKIATDITATRTQAADYAGQIEAIGKSQAVIEFNMDGTIIQANDNFLNTMGYRADEVQGQHHSLFADTEYKNSSEYRQFWEKLNRGEYEAGEFKRIGKGGKEIWIQASYNPIMDLNGKPFKVVKYATDVTEQKLRNADFAGQIEAIGKSQAVIEFNMDGTIIQANDNFLNTMGYRADEIKGQHHSMFADTEYKNSHEYRQFWETLNRGEYQAAEYKRIGKGGKVVWIQASYNPIMDLNNKPFKVVKYATDITGRKNAVNEIKRVLLCLSDGDLTTSIEEKFEGEFQELGDAINSFVSELRDTISQIKAAANTINEASTEIAEGNADLSSRTEEQASSLEETASSMEELTGTVRLNSENANQANSLASEASTVAIEGGETIQKVVTTMASINESANKISDIIGVIDGIAFQTNILALNAAVEAARAGEQGRGFAVVASEVRTLAQRSANAAKDIKELISDSVSKIENGNVLVNQSGETMEKVVTSIKRVNDIMSEIAAASAEQATGIDEVGKAITQMDEVTQQNAALVEEAAAAAESLQSQAVQLTERVASFKMDDSQQGHQQKTIAPSKALSSPAPRASKSKQRTPVAQKKIKAASPQEDEWESF
jgi:methyl-accepting chemotaxis protein